MNNLKAIDVRWFTEMGSEKPIGIVKAVDTITGETKFYIGTGYGLDESQDVSKILNMGGKVQPEYLENFFKEVQKDAM